MGEEFFVKEINVKIKNKCQCESSEQLLRSIRIWLKQRGEVFSNR